MKVKIKRMTKAEMTAESRAALAAQARLMRRWERERRSNAKAK